MNASAKAAPKCSLQTASSIRGDLRLPSTWRRNSQDLSSSAKAPSDFAALPPSPATHNRNSGSVLPQRRAARTRSKWWCLCSSLIAWVYNYPQLCFLLLFVSCTYASGLYATTQLATLLLRAARVPEAIANAQNSYESASLELQSASGCVVETSLAHIIDMKTALVAKRRELDTIAQGNANALDQLEGGIAACSTIFLSVLKASNSSHINTTHTSNSTTSSSSSPASLKSTQCFSNAFLEETRNATAQADLSREVLDQIRLVLLSQATAEASGALKLQTASIGGGEHRVDSAPKLVNIVDAIFNSTRESLDASAQSALHSLKAIQSDNGGDDNNSGSNGGQHLTLDGENPSLTVADVAPDLRATETLRTLKDTLLKRLRAILPSEPAIIDKIINATAAEWEFLEKRVQRLQHQTTSLQIELQRMVNTTWSHVMSSSKTTRTILLFAELEVVASMNDLSRQWSSATQAILASHAHALDAADERIQSLTDAFQTTRADGLKTRSHSRALEIDDFLRDDAFAQRQFHLLQRRSELQEVGDRDGSNASDAHHQQTLGTGAMGVRVRELVSAGIDRWRFVRHLLLSADWGYACLKILEVVIELWTDSYSDMASVDIRGISSIQNLVRGLFNVCAPGGLNCGAYPPMPWMLLCWLCVQTDAWKILKCKHDFASVGYFLVMQADLLLQIFLEYAVWICVGVAGTAALVLWKWDFLRVCGQDDARDSLLDEDQEPQRQKQEQTLVQSLLSTVLPIRDSSWNPLVEIESQSAFGANLSQSESWRLANTSERAWKNQTAALGRLQSQQQTLTLLTRMYDNCASERAETVSEVSVSDLCVNLDATNSQTLQRFPPSATLEQLSANNSNLTGSFDHCFPHTPEARTLASELRVHAMLDSQACAAEKALYLTVSSWWLLVVVWSANRFIAKMVVKACGLAWWRFLSANRLEFVGFCYEDGTIQQPESLASAVQEHLRDVRWSIALRVLGMVAMLACSAGVWCLVLDRML